MKKLDCCVGGGGEEMMGGAGGEMVKGVGGGGTEGRLNSLSQSHTLVYVFFEPIGPVNYANVKNIVKFFYKGNFVL